ncbi:ABC transporter ATP-binding protein [Nocardia donostiensis]|uniref:ABC transporter ATP-binding protein n=1 Tax=Nocardia donostiensis TaxID=1538463 RepID=A0A1W0B7T8_9NOCA|nr:ABC transporter ATP-binding protein [Nocardia donostiensis]ONM46312.1 ABC transporter ATP-binding protein [Nocardia donostiensis]OQS18577.1 ABC transporter ATP-binding protein [Nocardia donostiensis]
MKELLGEVRRPLGIAMVLQAAAAVAGILPFYAVAVLAGRLLEPGGGSVWFPVALGSVSALAALVLATAATMVSHLADARLQLHLRRMLIDQLGRVPLGWFSAKGSGAVGKVVRDDVHGMHHLVAHSLLDLTSTIAAPLTAAVILFLTDPWLALISLVPLVAGVVLFARSMSGSTAQFERYSAAQQQINTGIVEFVNGIAVVKTFGGGQRAHRKFVEAVDAFHDFFSKWIGQTIVATTASFLVVSAPAVLLLVLGVGSVLVISGVSTAPDLITAALLAPPLAAPLSTIGVRAPRLRAGLAAAGSVRALLAEPELPQAATPATPSGSVVQMRRVGFSYDGQTPVLRDVDLELRPGTVTALVGPSGAGKSTLALLAGRFFDVSEGQITLGGKDIRELDTRTLFQHIGFVFQETELPRMSVAANIRLGRHNATDEQVREAARVARIHDRIVRGPRGYDAIVGADVEFSGGERQRIAIARAVLADTPVLVLDEATAFADPESAADIQEALSELAAGRTLLVIAHRLRTIADADQIVVLDGGRVVQRGRHADLLAEPGRYSRMWQAQEGIRA